jgi:hypothetical protein
MNERLKWHLHCVQIGIEYGGNFCKFLFVIIYFFPICRPHLSSQRSMQLKKYLKMWVIHSVLTNFLPKYTFWFKNFFCHCCYRSFSLDFGVVYTLVLILKQLSWLATFWVGNFLMCMCTSVIVAVCMAVTTALYWMVFWCFFLFLFCFINVSFSYGVHNFGVF